ncbi:TPA: hypothetical protein HA281_06785 [Candidatus Woesearchaeota archaeon]|nr:hypothetical protein [Candidatus Woesearchaeota archaeon]HIH92474.1 hypothetical protein [Candidatus Woesearchaeota archaeon]HII65396.1 hypothetical protein [Candidatus Woesearchaeota archaeon]HIJ18468.1 hypothetical protein [Candidatus Woesearchaeota archaeon]
MGSMEKAPYKESVPPIDFSRDLDHIEFFEFRGMDDPAVADFVEDIEGSNDSIELHLVRTKSYREALVLTLPTSGHPALWEQFLREEQKTFGGSKIFYLSRDGRRILVLSVKDETMNKLTMVITRINKVNEKIHRYNSAAKRENAELFASRAKAKAAMRKDEVINFIQQNLKV